MVIGCGVPIEGFYAVEQAVMAPGYQTLVIEGVRQESGFQDTRGVLPDAVLDVLQAVFDVEDGVLPVQDLREFHILIDPAFLLGLAHGGELAFPGQFGGQGGIGQIKGVDDGPDESVALGLQGIDHQAVRITVFGGYVPLVQERIRDAQAVRHFHGVAGEDLGQGIFLGKEVEVFFVGQAVQRAAGGVRQGDGYAVWKGEGRTVGKDRPDGVRNFGRHRVPLRLGEPGMQACGAVHIHAHGLRRHRSCDGQRHHDVRPKLCHNRTKLRIIPETKNGPAGGRGSSDGVAARGFVNGRGPLPQAVGGIAPKGRTGPKTPFPRTDIKENLQEKRQIVIFVSYLQLTIN